MLGTYEKTRIFIPIDITEDTVKLVTQKFLGSYGTVGTYLEALQGWLLNFGEDRKRLRTIMETFIEWISNKRTTWADYSAFISGRLIALDK